MTGYERKQLKEQFIELRAFNEASFDKCSEELGVSKPTLIKWERQLYQHIQSLKKAAQTDLINNLCLNLENRLERLTDINERLFAEIQGRDLSDMSTDKLLKQFFEGSKRVSEIAEKLQPTVDDSNFDEDLNSLFY